MALIQITDLSFAYDGAAEPVFSHVTLQLDTAWKLGFTGRNGRGKTTFLQLLLGRYEYTGHIAAPCRFAYFPYPVPDESLPAGRLADMLCPGLALWQLQRELAALDISPARSQELLARPFATLSGGEQTKLLLAVLFCGEQRFLLIDEPTDHLDKAGRAAVSRYLAGKQGFILVSHDRAFLDGCIDHVLTINRADITVQQGSYTGWEAQKQRQDEYELAQNTRLKKEIRRLEDSAREKAKWAATAESRKIGFDPTQTEKNIGRRPMQGAKAAKLERRAKAVEKRTQAAIQEKSALLKNIETAESLKLGQLTYHSARLLEARDLALYQGERQLFAPVSFEVRAGDRLVLEGPNGVGKTSLLRFICGQQLIGTGDFHLGSGVKISHVRQLAGDMHGTLQDLAVQNGWDISLFLAILRKLDFARSQFDLPLQSYSAGQKKKVLLAGSLCEKAHLLIWDEPLNYIDILSRSQLRDLLLTARPTVIFVEHDAAFCDAVATKRVTLQPV